MLTFFLQTSGMEESPANLEMIDLFAQCGAAGCGTLARGAGAITELECLPLKDLVEASLPGWDGTGTRAGVGG